MTDPSQTSGFAQALAFALKWEVGSVPNGGYTNDPRDPGGETKYGISKRSYPHLNITGLTLSEARDIYYYDYWAAAGNQDSYCSELTWPLNAVHFDCTVNIGNRKVAKDGTVVMHRKANMILQRALGQEDDGYIGPVTRAALALIPPAEIAKRAVMARDLYYALLGPWSWPFQAGWYNRTNDLRRLVLPPQPAGNTTLGAR